MTKVTIAFKSGNILEFECEHFSVFRSDLTGAITRLEWGGEKEKSVLFAELSEIDYITSESGGDTK